MMLLQRRHGNRLNFTRDQITAVTIRHVEPGAIRIGNETISRNVALTVDGIFEGGPADNIEKLTEVDLEPLLAGEPEMIILGTGLTASFPPRELMFALARRGIGLEVMDTAAACRTFNILIGEGRSPLALLKIVED